MRIFINLISIFAVVLFETSLFSRLSIFGACFNLILLVIISLIFLHRSYESLIWAVTGGVLLDLISGSRFGFNTIGLTMVFLIVYYVTHNLLAAENIYIILGFTFGGVIIFNFIFLGLIDLFGSHLGLIQATKTILASGIINMVAMLILYPIIFWLDDNFFHRTERIGA